MIMVSVKTLDRGTWVTIDDSWVVRELINWSKGSEKPVVWCSPRL